MRPIPAGPLSGKTARVVWGLASVCLVTAISTLTLMAPGHIPSGPSYSDKVYHLIAFAALVLPTALFRPDYIRGVGMAALAYGGFIEIIQPFVGRGAEWADFVANVIGVLVGFYLGSRMRRLAQVLRSRCETL